jgi:hypothetical protein
LTLEARFLLHLPLAALHFLRITTIVLSHGAQDAHAATGTSSARARRAPNSPQLAGTFDGRGLAATDFEAVSAVDCLDVEDFPPREPKHAFDRRRDVFVHPIWKFDDHDRTLAWCAHEAAAD